MVSISCWPTTFGHRAYPAVCLMLSWRKQFPFPAGINRDGTLCSLSLPCAEIVPFEPVQILCVLPQSSVSSYMISSAVSGRWFFGCHLVTIFLIFYLFSPPSPLISISHYPLKYKVMSELLTQLVI